MAQAGKIHSPPPGRQKERPDQRLNVIGTRMLRKEDPRFLAGRGRFIDDITLPNMAHAAVLRSPHAHARIRSIDKSAAEALPGVVAVITGEEAARETAPLPCFANPPVEQRCIAFGKVRHVGEPVVLVVADSRYIAEDAIALINVVYEPLPADKRLAILAPHLGSRGRWRAGRASGAARSAVTTAAGRQKGTSRDHRPRLPPARGVLPGRGV